MMKQLSLSLLAVVFLACGGNDMGSMPGSSEAADAVSAEAPSSDAVSRSSVAGEASDLQRLPVSDAGAQLGLDHWEFEAGGIYGLNVDGEVLAEFHVRADNLAIESTLPERSVRKIDGSADFSLVTRDYYDALALDIRSLSDSADPAALPVDVEKVVVNCFLILDNCLAEAAQRLILFGQSCTCSLNVAQCGILLPLALDCN